MLICILVVRPALMISTELFNLPQALVHKKKLGHMRLMGAGLDAPIKYYEMS